jgi:hypothetical protein
MRSAVIGAAALFVGRTLSAAARSKATTAGPPTVALPPDLPVASRALAGLVADTRRQRLEGRR